ncbi:hypothetical protein [Sulfurovum sp.]
MKGNASCHIYTPAGRKNHDSIKWDSDEGKGEAMGCGKKKGKGGKKK